MYVYLEYGLRYTGGADYYHHHHIYFRLPERPQNYDSVKITVQGLFASRYFRSSERKFPLGTFAPKNESESSRELSFQVANVPGNIRPAER